MSLSTEKSVSAFAFTTPVLQARRKDLRAVGSLVQGSGRALVDVSGGSRSKATPHVPIPDCGPSGPSVASRME